MMILTNSVKRGASHDPADANNGMFRIEGRSGFSWVPRIQAVEVEAFDQLFNIVTVHLFRRILTLFL
jgi:hypothetical protein